MKKSSILVLLCCVLVLPTFSAAVGVFDKTADWTLATSKNKAPGSITAAGTGDAAVYTVKGNGDDIWNNADEGFFAYTAKTGSFSIQAKVKWVNPGDNWGANAANYEWAKVGVMINHRACFRLAGLEAGFGQFHAMVRAVADEVDEGVAEFLDEALVDFRILAHHLQLDRSSLLLTLPLLTL